MLKQEEIQRLFGVIVRKERKVRGLTQSQLAEKSNLDNTYISQIERGLANPSLFTFHKIVWSLNLSEYDIFQRIKKELSDKAGNGYGSEEDLKTIYDAVGNLNASLILTTTKDDDFRVIYCNEAFLKYLDSTRDNVIGKKFQDILSNGQQNTPISNFFKTLTGRLPRKQFIEMPENNGVRHEFELNASAVLNKDNKVDKHLFTLQKNGRGEADNEIIVYPRIEKYKTLLKESHHRIRNNLSIIVGIIDVNILEADGDEIKNVLKETQLRISSIAHIHEILLEPHENDSQVKVKRYLSRLTDLISETYKFKGNIILTKYIDIDKLEMHNGVTIGLLCNELITNSYKYAFVGRSENEINLTIKELEGSKILFSYEDNGVGFERAKFEEADSLGLSLIHTFMEDLKAKNIHVDTEKGFKLQFEINMPIEGLLS